MSRRGRPPEDAVRDAAPKRAGSRDVTPAVGTRGEASVWRRAVEGAVVDKARRRWEDAREAYLFKDGDTRYATGAAADDGEGVRSLVADANRRARGGATPPAVIQGPFINQPVWTWEVPLYFWFGGIATGASFVAVACDAAGDHRSARVARMVSLGAIVPGAPLLVLDLGRPERFLHMLRIFKTRSPMSMGAWCLSAFSAAQGLAVAADVADVLPRGLRRRVPLSSRVLRRLSRGGGAGAAVLGTYLGSYTGVLLASTAVPVWSRSRSTLPPIFVCTAVATGAAATRLALAASGTAVGHPTRNALGSVETFAMGAELALSAYNERRLGRLAGVLEEGRTGAQFRFAKRAVQTGLLLRLARRRGGPWVHHLASALYLAAGVAFRFGWVGAGRASAQDDEAVAAVSRVPGRDVRPDPAR